MIINDLEAPHLNVGNPMFWRQRGHPTFIERHTVNLQKAHEAKDKLRKLNKSSDININYQTQQFAKYAYDPIEQNLPRYLRTQQLNQTEYIKKPFFGNNKLQQNVGQGYEVIPEIQNQQKKQNISFIGLNQEQRKKLLSIDLSQLNTSNKSKSRQLNDSTQTNIQNNGDISQYNINNSMVYCESPHIPNSQNNGRSTSSSRVRESLFLLPQSRQISREQRKELLDDLEVAYFKFKKDSIKQRFYSQNDRYREQNMENNTRVVRNSKNRLKQNPLKQNIFDESVINPIESYDLMENRTVDTSRIQNIMNEPDQKIKSKRKLYNEIKEENGLRIPLRLHMMSKYRKSRIDEMINMNGNIDKTLWHPDDEVFIDMIWKNMPEYEKNQIKYFYKNIKVVTEERNKRNKEINSRKAQHTPIYDVLSLNKQQKKRVERLFQGVVPLESRFYAAVQNQNEIHYKKTDNNIVNSIDNSKNN